MKEHLSSVAIANWSHEFTIRRNLLSEAIRIYLCIFLRFLCPIATYSHKYPSDLAVINSKIYHYNAP